MKSDAQALAHFRKPIIVEDLLDEWPASNTRRWSFSALRARIGHALVDCGSSTGGVPFYLVAANAERSAGRADLALYVFDSDFSEDSGKAGLLRDVSGLPSPTGDVFNAGEAADDRDRPVALARRAGGLRHPHAPGPVVVLVVERVARRLEAVGALPARRVARRSTRRAPICSGARCRHRCARAAAFMDEILPAPRAAATAKSNSCSGREDGRISCGLASPW